MADIQRRGSRWNRCDERGIETT